MCYIFLESCGHMYMGVKDVDIGRKRQWYPQMFSNIFHFDFYKETLRLYLWGVPLLPHSPPVVPV